MKVVSYNKLSKKAKKEVNTKKRGTWNTNPATKIIPSKKAYTRKEKHRQDY